MSNTQALSNCEPRLFELILYTPVTRGSRNFCQRGSNFDKVFLVDERRDDQYTTKSGPLLVRQRSAILMVFRWRPNDGLALNSGLVALRFFRGARLVLLRKPIFCDLSGGGGVWTLSLLWICPCQSRNFQSCQDVSWIEPELNRV